MAKQTNEQTDHYLVPSLWA